jgi:hypothetical protein
LNGSASIETTLELSASPRPDVKRRMQPLRTTAARDR